MENYYAEKEKSPLATKKHKFEHKLYKYTPGSIQLIENSKTSTFEIIDLNGRILKRGYESSHSFN